VAVVVIGSGGSCGSGCVGRGAWMVGGVVVCWRSGGVDS